MHTARVNEPAKFVPMRQSMPVCDPYCDPSMNLRSDLVGSTYCLDQSQQTSILSTPSTPCLPRAANPFYSYNDTPLVERCSRPARYRTSRPYRRMDDSYLSSYDLCDSSKRDSKVYTIAKPSEKPCTYESFDKSSKLPSEIDLLAGSDRIYEIKKEKITIRAEKDSPPCTPRLRSKSSDRYLESRNLKVFDDARDDDDIIMEKTTYNYNPNNENDTSNSRRLRSRSNYYLSESRDNQQRISSESATGAMPIPLNESKYHNHQSRRSQQRNDRDDLVEVVRVAASETQHANDILNASKNCSSPVVIRSNEIVYVPMVKEEFIKREAQKVTDSTFTSGSKNNLSRF
jgi:hypothetical protein